MSRDGVISGLPAGAGLARFWVWNHDLTAAQGGPSWCEREDRSEREFSIPIDPGLAIVDASVKPATVGQPYSDALATKQLVNLNSLTGPDVQADLVLAIGSASSGNHLLDIWRLERDAHFRRELRVRRQSARKVAPPTRRRTR